nr:hypothetical protein [Tanacetum cinerariifolium]
MEHYIENRENGRMILNLVQNGPLNWPTVTEEDGTTRTKKYEEIYATEKIQADCDCKATNIILQVLPPNVYAIVNHHKVAKDIWDRFSQLIKNINVINMSMRPVDRGKGMDLLFDVALLEAAQLKKTLKKSKLETHKLHVSGSGDGVGSQPKFSDEQGDKTTRTDEGTDKKRSRIMIKAIYQWLFERRLMRNLEKFIGGREYGEDFRLLERTI